MCGKSEHMKRGWISVKEFLQDLFSWEKQRQERSKEEEEEEKV